MLRLFITEINKEIIIEDKHYHYLINVMKQNINNEVLIFDGKTGEYIYKITEINKKKLTLTLMQKTKEFEHCLNISLLFAPLKKEATDFVIQKATELGVKKIIPVITKRVNNHNFNQKRAELQAIEASEQCERLDIPQIENPVKLSDILKNWDNTTTLCPLLERTCAKDIYEVFSNLKSDNIAILVGPEGGFADEEKQALAKFEPISMGKRILRAETAAISAIACYQAIKGDFCC